jgi:Coenzyme PQQ synthesis protein D (PqqD)
VRFKTPTTTVSRLLGDELVLVNLSTNRMFSANETGAWIWDAIVRGDDLSDVRAQLVASADAAEAGTDFDAFVDMLVGEGLIERA